MDWIDEEISELAARSRLRTPTTVEYLSPTRVRIHNSTAVSFCGNDYLGLRHHHALAAAANEATSAFGTGSGASRLVSGNLDLHLRAEEALASLVGRPAALLASSGYALNVGALAALCSTDDVIFSDALNHASLVDGARLSRAKVVVHPHRDVEWLRREIPRHRPFRRGWVVTESLFSMDGTFAPLRELAALCTTEGLHLYVDEAHALGLYGDRGGGLCLGHGVTADVLIGTLGKALGGAGAFAAGTVSLRTWLWNRCRSFVFSTGVPPSVAGAALAAASLVASTPRLRIDLQRNIEHLRSALGSHNIPAGTDPRSPIFPIVVGDDARTVHLSRWLLEHGYFVQAIRPPTVPVGTARLRVTVSALHSPEEITGLAETLHHALTP